MTPTEIQDDAVAVLSSTHNYLSAYQILAQLPAEVRDGLIEAYGPPGAGAGRHYTAATAVAQAAAMLGEGRVHLICADGEGMSFSVAGDTVHPGDAACGFYRLV